jgi:hypothetical protein
MPCRSTTTWRFVPCLPRSVGFFPVFSPPRERPPSRHQSLLSSSRCDPLRRADARESDEGGPRPRLFANREAGASRSCPNRSPFPTAASPKVYRSSEQTGYLAKPPDPESAAALPSVGLSAVVAGARQQPTTHRKQGPWPCNKSSSAPRGFVRRSKVGVPHGRLPSELAYFPGPRGSRGCDGFLRFLGGAVGCLARCSVVERQSREAMKASRTVIW